MIDRNTILHFDSRHPNSENGILNFHPLSIRIGQIIKTYWFLSTESFVEKEEFMLPAPICNKRAPNLRDKLVHADMGSETRTPKQRFFFLHWGEGGGGAYPCLYCA